jgi:hypothetical protein
MPWAEAPAAAQRDAGVGVHDRPVEEPPELAHFDRVQPICGSGEFEAIAVSDGLRGGLREGLDDVAEAISG